MKRFALLLGLPAAFLCGAWLAAPREAHAQILNALTPAFLRTANWTVSGIWNFGSGVAVTAGQRVNLEGSSGDTYLIRETSTGFVRVYVDGVLKATITGNGVIPGACPSDVWTMETGTDCVDANGRRVTATATGPVVVTGSVPCGGC